MEYVAGPIHGSRTIPLRRLSIAALPEGPTVLVCQSGNRSARALTQLLGEGRPHRLADLGAAWWPGNRRACPSSGDATLLCR